MRLDLYQAETARVAQAQCAVLREVDILLAQGRALSLLEQGGMLHALQLLAENAIGKAKQLLKARKEPVPVSGYDAFAALALNGTIAAAELPRWNAVLGLRNRIVHDYMNIDVEQVLKLVRDHEYQFVVDFLQREFSIP